MTLPVARLGDTFTDTDVIATGSGDVFINNIPVARLGDITTGHTLPLHTFYPSVPIISGSGVVFANNLPIIRLAGAHAGHCDTPHLSSDCHIGVVNTASGDVFSG